MCHILLYDFSLQMGESVVVASFDRADESDFIKLVEMERVPSAYIGDCGVNHAHADSVVVLNDGTTRKCIMMRSSESSFEQVWYEGIGSSNGPFVHAFYGFLEMPHNWLLCFDQDGEQLLNVDDFDFDGDIDCWSEGCSWGVENETINAKVFPNPTKDVVYIELTDMEAKEIVVYNSTGQIVMQLKASNDKLEIDVSGLSDGLYVLGIKQQDAYTTYYKFIKSLGS